MSLSSQASDGSGVLAARELTVGYRSRRSGDRLLLTDLHLDLAAGELTCLLGPNGCGKSTLLRGLTGLQAPLAGQVTLDGRDLTALSSRHRARLLSIVLTEAVDGGLLRCADLVALGRYPYTGWSGRLQPADVAAVRWALRVTGVEALAGRRVDELSDGERQRVLIARALAQQPAVLALDEPTAFVDLPHRVELAELLRSLARECGLAVLLVTHDLSLALRSADTVWLIEPSRSDGLPAHLHVGAPEDLALDGVVGRAFASDEVHFDLATATFVARPGQLGTVAVTGVRPAATWVGWAMAREGLTVIAEAAEADLVVTATVAGGRRSWQMRSVAGISEHPDIASLVGAVRGLLPTLASVSGAGEQPRSVQRAQQS